MRPPVAIKVGSPSALETQPGVEAPLPAPAVPPAPAGPRRKPARRRPKPVVRRESRPAPAPAPAPERTPQGLVAGGLLLAFTVYLAFNAGGFFPGDVAHATLAACVGLVVAALLIKRPLEGVGPALAVPLALCAGFAAWTLASALWSEATGRAVLEFDRALLYLLVLALFGLLGGRARGLEWGLRGFAIAAVAICAVALTTRLAADIWPIGPNLHPERLSFPLTYWNALGLLAALGIVACLQLSSGGRESRAWRVAGAAAIPLLAATLLLTFSRGSLAVAALGLLAYALLARPPRLLTAFAATAVPVAAAMVASYQASTLSSARFASAEGVAEGHDLALVVLACVVVAALLRLLLLRFDDALDAWVPPAFNPRKVIVGLAAVALVIAVAGVAFGVPSRIGNQYESFVQGEVETDGEARTRLVSAGNNGRIEQFEVAADAFGEAPLRGAGAGTYELRWSLDRPYRFNVLDAHSLYIEVLGELGVVGLLLIGGALVAVFAGFGRRLGGKDRDLYAAAIAMGVVWAVHAGIDWDWEMPVVTIWLFAFAGLGLARPARGEGEEGERPRRQQRAARLGIALAACALALVPAAIAISQSRLDAAVDAFDRGDCAAAIDSAEGSLDALGFRAEPYEAIGYCQAFLGEPALAEEAMEAAVERDPQSWRAHYGLGLVRALDGRDPMPELYEAERLNPLELKVQRAIRAMAGGDPAQWRQAAWQAGLPPL
ncbi:MAG TPA: O-antigen ligase family protein [Solirubrobacterales bacterium]|nr:O-antigen ligase family protein [Solirubrobacterales bacterium]